MLPVMSRTTGRPRVAAQSAIQPLGDAGALLVVFLAAAIVVALACDLVGWRPLASQPASIALLVGIVALVVGVARTLRREGRDGAGPVPGRWWLRLVVAGPALVLVGYALASFLVPTATRVEWFLNGDHVRHVVLVVDEQARGALSYDLRVYPRGWHTGIALLWSALGGPGNPPQLAGLVSLMSTCTWLLSAALALATATLGASVASRVGVRTTPACVAGSVAGAATLWPSFLGNYQALGMESSLVAAVVLAVCLRELLERLGTRAAFLVCLSGLVVMGHTWQLLLPVSGIALLVAAWSYARGGSVRRWATVVVGGAVAALTVVPPFTAVATTVGVGQAVVADVEVPVPVLAAGLGVACALGLAWWLRRDRTLAAVLLLVCLPALTGVVLAVRLGIPVTQYYPGKLVWHTAALGLTVAGATLALAWQRLRAHASPAATAGRAVVGALAVLGVLVGVIAPSGALRGKWSTVDARTVLSLVGTPGAGRAQVVWSHGPLVTDTVTRILLDAYRPEADRVDTPQGPLTVAEECELLRTASVPVILTTMPEGEVRTRYACAPGAEILTP